MPGRKADRGALLTWFSEIHHAAAKPLPATAAAAKPLPATAAAAKPLPATAG